MRTIPAELCVKCKGNKLLCGLRSCPILERFRSTIGVMNKVYNKNEIQGSTPPSIVIGEKNYPKVSISFNIPPDIYGDEAKTYEDPKGWWGKASIYDIINYRTSLLSNNIEVKVEDVWKLYEKELSLAAVSEKPVQSQSKIDGTILPKLRFDGYVMPRGPSAKAQNLEVVENPRLNKTLNKLIFDDAKAEDAVVKLYQETQDVYTIINALSLGLLGVKKNRKLIPTRWAITAVDSIIGKNVLQQIRDYPEIDTVEVYYQKYLGNYFHIILYPSAYQVTWIEIWHPLSLWASELTISELTENYWGEYSTMDGGYMAARLAVLEHLEKIRRSSGIVIVREITNEYFAPLGNWHIRETVRKAMENRISKFDTLEKAIYFVNQRLNAKKVDISSLNSIKRLIKQKTIDQFFK
ncbi:Nre family DNA repair protein [Acidianus sp. HS-5]|uniref:Nre family DNA repair protein n=1 Tax=Acidianus sp. HS-5 TaxID=2886040 RepID=UPI001F448A8E|nr:Nre family DNA repair protein [Acidianus sp. HS-5]BDC19887.1 hypothetical protein HS5_27770 [Acidianus sp. HS-5]